MLEDVLTAAEMQIVALATEGYEFTEIGERLGYGPQTVKNRLNKIYTKLGLIQPGRRSIVLLTRLAVREQATE